MESNTSNSERKKIYYALFFPVTISFIIVIVFLFEKSMRVDFGSMGVFPGDVSTLWHVFTMPFIHSGWLHLFNNILSFLILAGCLYYFYGNIANRVLIFSLLVSGVLLWVIGREAWHIGLSGIIYALSFFLFFSGIFRKYIPLVAISLIIVFLYGSNVWHLFPWQDNDPISWEGHLSGAVSGVLLAVIYRKKGPQKPIVIWDDDDDDENDAKPEENIYWKNNNRDDINVI